MSFIGNLNDCIQQCGVKPFGGFINGSFEKRPEGLVSVSEKESSDLKTI